MRTPSLILGTLLAGGLAFAGGSEKVVYTDGNLTGITAHANAVLDVSQDKAMKLRVGRNDVSVPYTSIKSADSTAETAVVPEPGKKLTKQSQLLTIEFMSVKNEPRTMTLQMSKDASMHVLAVIHKHSANGSAAAAPATVAKADDKSAKPEKSAKLEKAAKAEQKDKSTDKQAKKDQKKADKIAKKEKKKEEKEVAANDAAKAKACAPDLPKGCQKGEWWGDNTWKTTRNLSKWEQQSSAPAAQ